MFQGGAGGRDIDIDIYTYIYYVIYHYYIYLLNTYRVRGAPPKPAICVYVYWQIAPALRAALRAERERKVTTNRHYRQVINLVKQGRGACIVCSHIITPEQLKDAVVTLIDGRLPNVVNNMALRHAVCQRSKYRPVSRQDTVVLVETMIASVYKLCPVCHRSWVGRELEELVVVERGGSRDVAHLVCL